VTVWSAGMTVEKGQAFVVAPSTKAVKLVAALTGSWTGADKVVSWSQNGTAIVNSSLTLIAKGLSPGKVYMFSVTVSQGSRQAVGNIIVRIAGAPTQGKCTLSPVEGEELQTQFKLECTGFGIPTNEKAYFSGKLYQVHFEAQLLLGSNQSFIGSRTTANVASNSTNPSASISLGTLPEGNFPIIVKATNSYGASVQVSAGTAQVAAKSIPINTGDTGGDNPCSGAQLTCCRAKEKADLVYGSTLLSSSQLFFLTPMLVSINSTQCSNSLWRQTYVRLNQTRRMYPLDQNEMDKISEALLYLFVSTPEAVRAEDIVVSVVLDTVQDLASNLKGYPSSVACGSMSALLDTMLNMKKFDCPMVEKAVQLVSQVRCRCTTNAVLTPGESSPTSNEGGATGEGVFSKCLASVPGDLQCGSSLPGNFSIDTSVWAQLSKSLFVDPVFGKVASVSIVNYGELVLQCRANSLGTNVVNSDITSIAISSQCSSLSLTNQSGNVNFDLPIKATGDQNCGTLQCVRWESATNSWSAQGCEAVVSANKVQCSCSNFGDFALLRTTDGCGGASDISSIVDPSILLVISAGLFSLIAIAAMVQIVRVRLVVGNYHKSSKLHQTSRDLIFSHALVVLTSLVHLFYSYISADASKNTVKAVAESFSALASGLFVYVFNKLVLMYNHYEIYPGKMKVFLKFSRCISIANVFAVIAWVVLSIALEDYVYVPAASSLLIVILSVLLSMILARYLRSRVDEITKRTFFRVGVVLTSLFVLQAAVSVVSSISAFATQVPMDSHFVKACRYVLVATTLAAILWLFGPIVAKTSSPAKKKNLTIVTDVEMTSSGSRASVASSSSPQKKTPKAGKFFGVFRSKADAVSRMSQDPDLDAAVDNDDNLHAGVDLSPDMEGGEGGYNESEIYQI